MAERIQRGPADTGFEFAEPVAPVDILVISAEHSGDQNAGAMVADLLGQQPQLQVYAFGGPRLEAAGARLLRDLTATSVIGFVDAIRQIKYFKALLLAIVQWIDLHRPRLVCFVDSSGLNLRIAKALREKGISAKGGGNVRTVYYISPQIWASRPKRRFMMAEVLDALGTIFPFETESYADTDLPVEFVGHPFLTEGHVPPVRYDPGAPILLLPGSRASAVRRIFPAMLGAHALRPARPAVVIYPSERIRAVLTGFALPPTVSLTPAGTTVAASAALTTSGTMSMHCALAGIPGAVIYKTSWLEYWLGRLLITVPHIGIANLLLKEVMYPEYIQGAATPRALAVEIDRCLSDSARIQRTHTLAARLKSLLRHESQGAPGAWLARQLAAARAR